MDTINSERDTRLDTYNYAKTLAKDSVMLVQLQDKGAYKTIKSNIYDKLDSTMRDLYFPHSGIGTEGIYNPSTIKVDKAVGEDLGGSRFKFKVTFTISRDGLSESRTMLVGVYQNKIVSIDNI